MTQAQPHTTTSPGKRRPSKAASSFKLVKIVWEDVLEDVAAWEHGEPSLAPVTVSTVGILYKANKNHITLIRDLYWDGEGNPVTGGRLALPRGMIVEIIEMGELHAPQRNT